MNANELGTKKRKSPGFRYSFFFIILVLGIIVAGNRFLSASVEPMFFLSWLIVIPACLHLGYSFRDVEHAMLESCKDALGAVLILLAVGAMIACWMASGTVPMFVYIGLNIIRPVFFLPVAFILCLLVAIATGTSWGTMGTIGIAMYTVGLSIGIPAHATVGAVISGAFLGDVVSPMGGNANIATATCGIEMHSHIKAVSVVAIPAFMMICVSYYALSIPYAGVSYDRAHISDIASKLKALFSFSPVVFLPAAVLFGLLFLKIPALISMLMSALSALVVAVMVQDIPASQTVMIFWNGYHAATGDAFIDSLLNRGGSLSMSSTCFMLITAFGLIGAFRETGMLHAIIIPVTKRIRSMLQLTIVTQFLTVIGNLMGSNSFSLILTNTLMKPVYEKMGNEPEKLSRVSTATAIPFSVLIPWNASAIYAVRLFDVPTGRYAPYALIAFVLPLAVFLHSVIRKKN